MSKPLTAQPHIDWLKKTAKQHLAELRVVQPDAQLHEAQLAVARDYGFASWRALKAEVDARSLDGRIASAAATGDADTLARLLADNPRKLVLTRGPWKRPLLHLAAENGHLACVELLLRRGVEVDLRDRTDNATALHWAAAGGHLAVVKRLVAAGADVDGAGDRHAVGVLGWATCFDQVHAEVADFLLSRGARPTMLAAVALGREDLVRQLSADPAELGLHKMSRFGHHRAPLHLAVLKNRTDMVRLLLELGADVRAKDSRGYTPLNLVSPASHTAIAGLLIAGGADPAERGSNRFEHLVPVLNVADLARSLAYYVGGLGFEKQWEYGEPPTFAAIRRDQVQIFLSQEDPKRLAGSLSIFVQDVDALYADYRRSGAVILRPPTDFPWGVRGMDLEDPDGHRLRMTGDGAKEHRSKAG
jgi:uncharacterized glyoxalase superfamily protein PhnB